MNRLVGEITMQNSLIRGLMPLLCLFVVLTVSAEEVQVGELFYTVSDGVACVSRCNPQLKGTVSVPESVAVGGVTYPVTGIGEHAFAHCYGLRKIHLGSSLTRIGKWAFLDCSKLRTVIVPDAVTEIGEEAFAWCRSLKDVYSGRSLTTIGEGAFLECHRLKKIFMYDPVTVIGDRAFAGCYRLQEVLIGRMVTSVGNGAFWGAGRIRRVIVQAERVPVVAGNAFEGSVYDRAELCVPRDAADDYRRAECWKHFRRR